MEDKKTIYIKVGVLLISVLLVIFLGIPLLKLRVEAVSMELLEKRQELEAQQKKQMEFAIASREYQRIEPQITKISQSFLDEEKVIDFIIALEQAAQRTGNKYEINLIGQTKEEKNNFDAVSFQISLKGDFSAILHFMAELESFSYFNEVSVIQIQRTGAGKSEPISGEGEISANLNIRTFINR